MPALSLTFSGEDDLFSPAEGVSSPALCKACDPAAREEVCTGACAHPPSGVGLIRCLHYTIREAQSSGFHQTARLLELARIMLTKELKPQGR